MSQDKKPAPFNLGDHVRYVATERRVVPNGHGDEMDQTLAPGMEGVIMLSTGALSSEGAAAPDPWRCQVQFQNGFRVNITAANCADFEMTHSPGSKCEQDV